MIRKLFAPVTFAWRQNSPIWTPIDPYEPSDTDFWVWLHGALRSAGFNAMLAQVPRQALRAGGAVDAHVAALGQLAGRLPILPYLGAESFPYERVGDVHTFADRVVEVLHRFEPWLWLDEDGRPMIGLWYVDGAREAPPGFLPQVADLVQSLGLPRPVFTAHPSWKKADPDWINRLFANPRHVAIDDHTAAVRPGFWNPSKGPDGQPFVKRRGGKPFRRVLRRIARGRGKFAAIRWVFVESVGEKQESSCILSHKALMVQRNGRSDRWGDTPEFYLDACREFSEAWL